jgi:hypothetical protein
VVCILACKKEVNDNRTSGALVFYNDDTKSVQFFTASGGINQGREKQISNLESEANSNCKLYGNRFEIYVKDADLSVVQDISWIKSNLDFVKGGTCKN